MLNRLYKIFGILLICCFSLSIHIVLPAQETDTTRIANIEFITDQLENIAQSTDLSLDYSDLIDDYLYYYENPINLNGSDLNQLVELHLINDIQLNNLYAYINKYGQFYSLYEIRNIPGFDPQTIQNILPFIAIEDKKESEKLPAKKILKYGKHQIILRYSQILEPSLGFTLPVDSAQDRPGSTYLGSPQSWYARYSFNFNKKVRFGFTLDRDAGEIITKNQVNDSIKILIGNKADNIFDFFSAHIYVSEIGILKKAVIGDYHLEVGQGLTLWSGLAFGKSAEATQIKRFGKGIRPNTSVNENRFFRGGAFTLGWKGISLTAFYSRNNIDASISSGFEGDDFVSSIVETGKHRTINELLVKDALIITAYGGRLAGKFKFFEVGATAYQSQLSAGINAGDDLYRLFYFENNKLFNFGVDLNFSFNKINFFGEFSGSSPGGFAGIAGLNTFISDRFIFTILYHDYGKDYHNLYSNPFTETSAMSNERGLYLGFRALLAKRLSLSGYVDHFQFPWLRYRTNGPSIGKDYLLQLNYNISRNVDLYFRYRYRLKQENYPDEYDYLKAIADVERNEFRFFISYRVFDALIFKNRIDYVLFKKEFEEMEPGYLIYQDVLYRPASFPLEITFRYALFDTKSYDSRVYTYENDLLYAFSIPSYFDKGQRVYLMLRYKALRQLLIWFRVARTIYSHRTTIGSGADKIDGNTKTEVKVQVIIKL